MAARGADVASFVWLRSVLTISSGRLVSKSLQAVANGGSGGKTEPHITVATCGTLFKDMTTETTTHHSDGGILERKV